MRRFFGLFRGASISVLVLLGVVFGTALAAGIYYGSVELPTANDSLSSYSGVPVTIISRGGTGIADSFDLNASSGCGTATLMRLEVSGTTEAYLDCLGGYHVGTSVYGGSGLTLGSLLSATCTGTNSAGTFIVNPTCGGGTTSVQSVSGTSPVTSTGGQNPVIGCATCAVTNGANTFTAGEQRFNTGLVSAGASLYDSGIANTANASALQFGNTTGVGQVTTIGSSSDEVAGVGCTPYGVFNWNGTTRIPLICTNVNGAVGAGQFIAAANIQAFAGFQSGAGPNYATLGVDASTVGAGSSFGGLWWDNSIPGVNIGAYTGGVGWRAVDINVDGGAAVNLGGPTYLTTFGAQPCLGTNSVGLVIANPTCGGGTTGVQSVTASSPITSSGGANPAIGCATCAVTNAANTYTAGEQKSNTGFVAGGAGAFDSSIAGTNNIFALAFGNDYNAAYETAIGSDATKSVDGITCNLVSISYATSSATTPVLCINGVGSVGSSNSLNASGYITAGATASANLVTSASNGGYSFTNTTQGPAPPCYTASGGACQSPQHFLNFSVSIPTSPAPYSCTQIQTSGYYACATVGGQSWQTVTIASNVEFSSTAYRCTAIDQTSSGLPVILVGEPISATSVKFVLNYTLENSSTLTTAGSMNVTCFG